MDMNNGRIYRTKEEALAAGVSEGDLHQLTGEQEAMLRELPAAVLKFRKGRPFASIRNLAQADK
jgi:hypothetical protein